MERYLKQRKIHFIQLFQLYLLIILDFNQCHGLKANFTGDQKGLEAQSSSPPPGAGRNERQSKQLYYLPVVLWSPPLRILLGNTYSANGSPYSYQPHLLQHFLPLNYQQNLYFHETHPSSPSSVNSAVVGSASSENYGKYYPTIQLQQLHSQDFFHQTASHASQRGKAVACTTGQNLVGTCKPFAECFPMLEMEYGSENYMDSPLAEQLALNTNDTLCSESGSEKVGKWQSICCPNAYSRTGLVPVEGNGIGDYYNDDYSVQFPTITQRPPQRLILSRQLIEKKMCGQPNLQRVESGNRISKALANKGELKITGGHEARSPEEFPWMAGIFGKNRKLFCGASLITEQFLLTAAHCVSMFSPADVSQIYVHLGDFNIKTTSDGPHEVRKVDKLIVHKNFRIENYHNDIALLKLDRPVNFTSRIHPICLPEPTMKSLENKKLIVTGWGRKYRYGSLSDVLRKVEMPIWDHNECKRIYSTFAPGRVLDSNLCAGDGRRNKDACIGDSGGPAISFDGEKWVVQGIVSWGKGCGSFPGVYTRVDKHLMWLTSNLNKYST